MQIKRKRKYEVEISEELVEYIQTRTDINWSRIIESAIEKEPSREARKSKENTGEYDPAKHILPKDPVLLGLEMDENRDIRQPAAWEERKRQYEEEKQAQEISEALGPALYKEALNTGNISQKLPKLEQDQAIMLVIGLLEHAASNPQAVARANIHIMEGYKVNLVSFYF